MRSIANFAPVLAALTFALTASADVPKIHQSSVSFAATGPAGLAIKGTGNKVSTEKAKEAGKVVFRSSIWNMKTGMDLRDEHLNDHLKAKGPDKTASLTISEKVVEECKKPGCKGVAKGEFSMNGATKTVDVKYDSKKGEKGLVVNGRFEINISDYIKKPCYLGVCVNDEIKINVVLHPKE